MRLDPPKVLLEESFLAALADRAHTAHTDCAATYSALLDDAEHGRVLLVAVADHLRSRRPPLPDQPVERLLAAVRRVVRPTGLLAPVHPLHVGRQHRRAAGRATTESSGIALTLVMCERHRIDRVATVDRAFHRYRLHLVTVDPATR